MTATNRREDASPGEDRVPLWPRLTFLALMLLAFIGVAVFTVLMPELADDDGDEEPATPTSSPTTASSPAQPSSDP